MRSIMPRLLQARQKSVDRVDRQVFVVVVVQLEHRRGAARAQALDAHERELPVRGRLPVLMPSFRLEVTQRARRSRGSMHDSVVQTWM